MTETVTSNYNTKVFRNDRTIKISTVSPNGKFFYKIKEPKDLLWGLFCSPIAFFDTDESLIYHNKTQYAQVGVSVTKGWEIVSWSLSGNFAFFIERNSTETFQYILLDLVNRTVSKTDFQIKENNSWTSELFNKLPDDKAQEAYQEIISCSSANEVFDYVLSLKLINDKRRLIKSLEHYCDGFKTGLRQFERGNFDEAIIPGSMFDIFTPINPDKLQKGILEIFGFDRWRP
jgi:hypothetical protein